MPVYRQNSRPKSFIEILLSLKDVWNYRQLILQLAKRDLKSRYKVSVLGFFWSLLRPLLTIIVLAAVFSSLQFESTRYNVTYPVLLLAVYMPWFFFSSAVLEATTSLLANANLVKKVYCPRAIFPVSVVLANLVNFGFSLVVLFPLLYLGTSIKPSWTLLQLPFLIAIHTLFLLGLSFLTSITNVLYRDTMQITEFVVFVWFYISPVLYDIFTLSTVFVHSNRLLPGLYFLNPMAGILEWYRYVLLSSTMNTSLPDPELTAHLTSINQIIFSFGIPYAIVISIAIFFLGYYLFKKVETRAVDEL